MLQLTIGLCWNSVSLQLHREAGKRGVEGRERGSGGGKWKGEVEGGGGGGGETRTLTKTTTFPD